MSQQPPPYEHGGPIPQPQPHAAAPAPKNGAGLAALILGIVAIAVSWIPIVNYLAIVLGLVGLALAIVGLVQVRRRRATNTVVTVIGGVLSVAAIVVMVAVSAAFANALDDVSKDLAAPEETLSASPEAAAAVDEPTAEETSEAPAEPTYAEPTVKDFALTLKVLEKSCFGSAGCNVTYRVEAAYNGAPLDPDKTYEVTYEVRGGEDPKTSTFTATGDSYERPSEDFISTSSSSSKLTAVVTDVAEY